MLEKSVLRHWQKKSVIGMYIVLNCLNEINKSVCLLTQRKDCVMVADKKIFKEDRSQGVCDVSVCVREREIYIVVRVDERRNRSLLAW